METLEVLEKYSKNTTHAFEVKRLALLIFDNLTEYFDIFSEKDRLYLECASLLHDIGYYINSTDHHKHSQRWILENNIERFSQQEKEIISCIARYHRGSLPDKAKHDVYCNLDKNERKTVKRLAGILKIADSLDSDRMMLIKDININYDEPNNIVEIVLTPNNSDFYPEINYSKRDLLELALEAQIVFKFFD